MIKWSSRLATGIEMVDSHHKGVFELITTFITTFRNEGPDRGLVEAALTVLAQHSRSHFAEEEALMHYCGIDSRHICAHRKEHRTFIDDIEQLAAQMDVATSEKVKEISEQLVRFMTAWLMLHIVSMDQAMASQISAIESGYAPQAAFASLQSDQHAAASSRLLLHSVLDLWRDSFDECRRLEARLSALTPSASLGVQLSRWPLIDQPGSAVASPITAARASAARQNGYTSMRAAGAQAHS